MYCTSIILMILSFTQDPPLHLFNMLSNFYFLFLSLVAFIFYNFHTYTTSKHIFTYLLLTK